MPESRESECSFIICDEYFDPLLVQNGSLPLEEKEQKRFPLAHPARSGLPYSIDSTCTAKRGTNKSQGSIYPPIRLGELALVGIEYTYRGLILNLGALFLMSSIKLVDKKLRKFHVGMALIFKDHVLAFHSHDLVFQPPWAFSRDDLPASAADFYSPKWDFSSSLVTWMLSRLDLDRNGLACEVIRAANDVFFGIGFIR
ncbi:hypothetical protein R3P38DRAFT_2913720 [Favolaschia claudopus]|uniref:Uncharacterized protein n=1 Tax=Favolaschia claudopus TaxID=2862362 RepID=A0AAW0C6M1_9AGAR